MPVPVNYINYGTRKYNIYNLTYLKGSKEVSIDTLPFSEKWEVEVIYTANYVLEQYSDNYSLTDEECVEVADKARDYMGDYGISEEEAIDEALEYYGYDERYEEEE